MLVPLRPSFSLILLASALVEVRGSEDELNNTITLPVSPPPLGPQLTCEPITDVSLCDDVSWNITAFPNLRGHTTQTEANFELEQFRGLIQTNCSGAIVLFLCSIYTPYCIRQDPPTVLRPCKSLCQHVRDGCEPIFNERAGGLPWPDHLDCDNYEDNNLCFGPEANEIDQVTIPPNLDPSHPTPEVTTPEIEQGSGDEVNTTNLEPITPSPLELCEPITDVSLCVDVTWNITAFPNLRGHTTQTEANRELEQFRRLIQTNCSGAIVLFLCSIYTPYCIRQDPPTVLRPCKSLCQHVRDGCEPIFNERAGGLPWPDHLDCDNYEDNNLCFGPEADEIDQVTIPPNLVPSHPTPEVTTPESDGTITSITPPTLDPSRSCELMTDVSLCAYMQWNFTSFPNIRGHRTQTEADTELEHFRQLIETKCSGAIVLFLCSIYTPYCIRQDPPTVLRPCKSLCQHVRDGCEPIFNERAGGHPWPDHLDCDNYEDNNLCFGPEANEIDQVTIPPNLVPSHPTPEVTTPEIDSISSRPTTSSPTTDEPTEEQTTQPPTADETRRIEPHIVFIVIPLAVVVIIILVVIIIVFNFVLRLKQKKIVKIASLSSSSPEKNEQEEIEKVA